MNNIRAVIIDDEPHCIANLRHYIDQYCPRITIVATAASIAEATHVIQQGGFDLAFLDIELCGDTSFSLLENHNTADFAIVFVTAYDRYAVKAFRVEAIDYLLKPLGQQEISSCYEKICKYLSRRDAITQAGAAVKSVPVRKKVILREREHMFIVDQDDILYLKGTGAYTEAIFRFDGKTHSILISKTLSFLEEEYDPGFFFRVHKSYLINLNRVTGIHKKDVPMVEMQNKEVLPIAKRRFHDLLALLNRDK